VKIGITLYPTYGGSGAVATELGIQLARRGHEIHFISYAQPFRLQHFLPNVFFHAVEVTRYPLFEYPPYSLSLTVKMHDVATRHRLDLMHVHYAVPHAASAWMAKQLMGDGRLPVVTTLHGTDITLVGQDPSYFRITKFSIEQSDGITAVSQWLKDETYRAFSCIGCDIRVVPNFVDVETFRPDPEPCHRDALARPDEKILMHISNFRPVKRVRDIVGVAARVMRQVPARLLLVGDGPERPAAEEEARAQGIADRVVFLGKLESVAEVLPCADLYLLTSDTESFGLSALEAMACGVPVVGSRVGGLPEVVESGVTGELLPVGDLDGMAQAALSYLTDEGRARRAAEAGRARAVERFSAERVVPAYEAVYGEVLAR
jgi:N-acetyl-alpha-D-glucosaminyl L-malate synthase BshA